MNKECENCENIEIKCENVESESENCEDECEDTEQITELFRLFEPTKEETERERARQEREREQTLLNRRHNFLFLSIRKDPEAPGCIEASVLVMKGQITVLDREFRVAYSVRAEERTRDMVTVGAFWDAVLPYLKKYTVVCCDVRELLAGLNMLYGERTDSVLLCGVHFLDIQKKAQKCMSLASYSLKEIFDAAMIGTGPVGRCTEARKLFILYSYFERKRKWMDADLDVHGIGYREIHPALGRVLEEIRFGPELLENIFFRNRVFVLTGVFRYGLKKDIAERLEEYGAIVRPSVQKGTNYVVIGEKGSVMWDETYAGKSVTTAIALQKEGRNIVILHEWILVDAMRAMERMQEKVREAVEREFGSGNGALKGKIPGMEKKRRGPEEGTRT